MFDMRLGLALHKSRAEIRAMPYPEYREWLIFYLIEPWGWLNEEMNTARLLSMLHNIHAKKPKPVKDFIRDMVAGLLEALKPKPDLDDMTLEEKKILIAQAVKRDFGI